MKCHAGHDVNSFGGDPVTRGVIIILLDFNFLDTFNIQPWKIRSTSWPIELARYEAPSLTNQIRLHDHMAKLTSQEGMQLLR